MSAAAARERVEHVPRLNFTDICQPRAAILQLTPPLRAAPAQPSPAPVAPLIYRYNQPLLLDSLFNFFQVSRGRGVLG